MAEHNHPVRVGGVGHSRPADATAQEVADQVRAAVEQKLGHLPKYHVTQVATQVRSAGSMLRRALTGSIHE